VTVVVVLLAGCASADDVPPEERTTIEVRGDTTFVTTVAGWSPPVSRAKVHVVLQGDDLNRPTGIARAGDRVVVADYVQLHLLEDDGSLVMTAGGFGDAPGEFGTIMAVGSIGDTTLVLDYRLRRVSMHSYTGDPIGSVRALPAQFFVNPRPDVWRMRPWAGGVLYQSAENIHVDRPTQAAILWSSLSGDSTINVRSWDDIDWMHEAGTTMPKQLFGPRAHVAIGSDGLYAFGDGVEYCFMLETIGDPAVRRICREWERVAVTPDLRTPNPSAFEHLDDSSFGDYTNELDQMEIGEKWASFDRLVVDESDRVWVRRLGPEQAISHPHLWNPMPELRPDSFAWDVFSTGGELTHTVTFPGGFEPQLIEEGQAFGLWRLPDGEVTVGKATW